MSVSIVIPAHNAAETLGEALTSLRAQTLPAWEAIVVDDGSRDETATIAATFAARDARIVNVSQPQMGVSAARNTGIGLARFDWLLFLDADDWLSPLHLERMTGVLVSDPDLDAVHCGWARVTPEGQLVDKAYRKAGDLFALLARGPAFVIHACIVRRSLVQAIGEFDTSLRTCEDWDLWQRIARTGVRIGAIDDVLALYRMRPSSASLEARQMLVDGLRVISQGYSSDDRVPQPKPEYVNGLPIEDLASTKALFACWCAGLVLGRGEDARPLLDVLKDDHCPELDPSYIADSIFKAAVLPRCRPLTAWEQLWPGLEPHLDEFLLALEAQSMAPELARRARTILQRLTLEHSSARRPLTVGAMHAVRVEITEPIPDILPPAPAERLHCAVELEGARLGTLELPICDGLVSSYVLADAIAAEYAWPILGRFFERTVYRDLSIEEEPNGMSLRRGRLSLATGLPNDARAFRSQVHDRVGWVVFLQEVWARPEWPNARFYDPQAVEKGATQRRVNDGSLVVEVSEDPPDVEVACQALNVVLSVGGTPLGVVAVPVERKTVRAHELRATLTMASGFELCRAVVREGLLGRPLSEPLSLRGRLAAAAAVAQRGAGAPALDASVNTVFAPGSGRALSRSRTADERGLLIGRRSHAAMGTSVCRRAMLPAAAAQELVEAASVAGEPVIGVPRPGGRPERVVYAPHLIWRVTQGMRASARRENALRPMPSRGAAVYDRHHFEVLFAMRPDPWGYTTPYEQTKYEQTLALLPSSQIKRALELACAEGHFTAQLAPRVRSLIAADISAIALDRAGKRCAGLGNVRFARLDLTRDLLPGRFELIVCSEVLYYVGGRKALRTVARKLVDALEPGGYLVTAHTNLIIDEPDRTGFDWDLPFGAKIIGETLASTRPLRLVKELRTPLYRIQLFQHDVSRRFSFRRNTPVAIEIATAAPLPPEVGSRVLWHGGRPRHGAVPVTVLTDRLPILLYHRVAPADSASMTRYRVSPEAFEEQLCYLRDAGYYNVSLEEWRTAVQAKKPLAGRAVLITFDNDYRSFLTHAWPLLRRYGFSATIFLVTDAIGLSNTGDRVYREEMPLLGWEEIQRLQGEGVEFGSHSVSHRALTALSPVDVVREGARSRAILQRRLGVPINAFAYPYGDTDRVVQHLIGACGYIFGLSCRPGLSRFADSLLALPRIEVTGSDRSQDFIAKLSS